MVVATAVVNFAFVEYGRSLEEAFEELFDTKRDNPIAKHRDAVYDEKRADHNRHGDCSADGIEEGEETEDDFKD